MSLIPYLPTFGSRVDFALWWRCLTTSYRCSACWARWCLRCRQCRPSRRPRACYESQWSCAASGGLWHRQRVMLSREGRWRSSTRAAAANRTSSQSVSCTPSTVPRRTQIAAARSRQLHAARPRRLAPCSNTGSDAGAAGAARAEPSHGRRRRSYAALVAAGRTAMARSHPRASRHSGSSCGSTPTPTPTPTPPLPYP